MPRLLEDRAIGGALADVATRLYAGQTPGNVLQVGPDGKSLVLGPLVGGGAGSTGPTGPGAGATGATGPAGSATISSVGPRQILFSSPGNYTWTVPNNTNYIILNVVGGGSSGGPGSVTQVAVQDYGGGGSDVGAGTSITYSTVITPGPTGQAGGSLRVEAQVTPGGTVTITVGAGGLGLPANSTSFSSPGSSSAVGGLINVNNASPPVTNIVCNGGSLSSATGPVPRAGSSPSGLFSPFLQEYGQGGTGGDGYGVSGAGSSGAVLIEWVQVT